jgi:hypothetical protein
MDSIQTLKKELHARGIRRVREDAYSLGYNAALQGMPAPTDPDALRGWNTWVQRNPKNPMPLIDTTKLPKGKLPENTYFGHVGMHAPGSLPPKGIRVEIFSFQLCHHHNGRANSVANVSFQNGILIESHTSKTIRHRQAAIIRLARIHMKKAGTAPMPETRSHAA